jgi:hypothetical protein
MNFKSPQVDLRATYSVKVFTVGKPKGSSYAKIQGESLAFGSARLRRRYVGSGRNYRVPRQCFITKIGTFWTKFQKPMAWVAEEISKRFFRGRVRTYV